MAWLLMKSVLCMLVLPCIPGFPGLFLMPQPSPDAAAFQRHMGKDVALPFAESVDAEGPEAESVGALQCEAGMCAPSPESVLTGDHAAIGAALNVPGVVAGESTTEEGGLELGTAPRPPVQPAAAIAGLPLPEGGEPVPGLASLNARNPSPDATEAGFDPSNSRRSRQPKVTDPAPRNMPLPLHGSFAMSPLLNDETFPQRETTVPTLVSKDAPRDDPGGRSNQTMVQPPFPDLPDLADRIVSFLSAVAGGAWTETSQPEWHISLHGQTAIREQAAFVRMFPGPQPLTHPPALQQVMTALLALDTHEGQRVTEITLVPETLGRLRVEVISDGGTLLVRLSAEQSETQDLLRRQSEHLIQDLRQSGLSGAALEFGTWQDRRTNKHGLPEAKERPTQAWASEGDVLATPIILGPPMGHSLHLRL